ncbi:MAG: cystathionine beta-lyase [Flavobacteriales bacterium]|nr:MAG: cystathionine beta-lyase [Flavobacteriales bacterium]
MGTTHKPAEAIQDNQHFGEFGGVNPSISDSATYTFMAAKTMMDTFEGKQEGCYLYSRHSSPSNLYLSEALAAMEGTEDANVMASGMGAITSTILQICGAGDHVVSSRTIYGGSYAFLKNFTPKEIANIPELAKIAKKHNLLLVVDNTFSPMIVSPKLLGADIVIHSLTKFINGMNDTVGGTVCASKEFITAQKSVIDGAAMLLGPTMDSLRSASILKNLHTLALRVKKHSENAMYVAERLEKDGLKVVYPGLKSHKDHELIKALHNEEYGYGGMMTIDAGTLEKADELMELMQDRKIGYLAVSLGFYKTLFNAPGTGTSSEVPEDEQKEMGLDLKIYPLSKH